MSKQDNGGPAFPPNAGWKSDHPDGWGITYLDYAAIMLPGPTNEQILTRLGGTPDSYHQCVAKLRYEQAAAMLAEKRRREKED